MIDLLPGFFMQVPWVYVFFILAFSAVFIGVNSRSLGVKARDELSVLIKGIVFVALLSFLVFSSVAVLKYASYLKIDIMHLTSFEFFVFCMIFVAGFCSKLALADKKNGGKSVFYTLSKVAYPLQQVVLYFFMLGVVYHFNAEIPLIEACIAVLAVNVIYHLYYVKVLDKMFVKGLCVFDKADSFVDKVFLARDFKKKGRGI